MVTPALRAIDVRTREAAATLGASPLRSLVEIDLPLVSRALAGASGFAFAIALGEFGATVFIARAERPTLPVAIFRFIGRPGAENQGLAAALAVCLALLTALVVLLGDRAGKGLGRAL
jgi:thiamine transport system permease protein